MRESRGGDADLRLPRTRPPSSARWRRTPSRTPTTCATCTRSGSPPRAAGRSCGLSGRLQPAGPDAPTTCWPSPTPCARPGGPTTDPPRSATAGGAGAAGPSALGPPRPPAGPARRLLATPRRVARRPVGSAVTSSGCPTSSRPTTCAASCPTSSTRTSPGRIGAAFAEVVAMPEGATGVVIGHDMRASRPALAARSPRARCAAGSTSSRSACARPTSSTSPPARSGLPGAMFTASHNPAQYNGIKLCRAGARPVGQDTGLAEIRDRAERLPRRRRRRPPARPAPVTERDLLADVRRATCARLVDLSRHPAAQGRRRRRQRHGRLHRARRARRRAGCPRCRSTIVPLYFELDGTVPQPRGQPARARRTCVDLQARGRRARRRPRARLRRRRRPLLRRRRARRRRSRPVAITALVAARELAASGPGAGDGASTT